MSRQLMLGYNSVLVLQLVLALTLRAPAAAVRMDEIKENRFPKACLHQHQWVARETVPSVGVASLLVMDGAVGRPNMS